MKSQIDSLYHLNMSHVITNEKDMMVFVSLMRKRNFNIIQNSTRQVKFTQKYHQELYSERTTRCD